MRRSTGETNDSSHMPRSRDRHAASRHALAVAALGALLHAAAVPASATLYTSLTTPLAPVPGPNNQALLTLTNVTPVACNPTCPSDTDTSFVTAGSAIGVTYDTRTRTVTITSASLAMTDVSLKVGALPTIAVTDVAFELDPNAPAVQGVVDPVTHELALTIPAIVSATALGQTFGGAVDVPVSGTFLVDIPPGGTENTMLLTNPSTPIAPDPFDFQIGPITVTFQLTGTVTFNFRGTFTALFDDTFEGGTLDAWVGHVP